MRIQNETARSGLDTSLSGDTPDSVAVDPAIELKDLRKVMKDAGYKMNNDEEYQSVVEFVKEMKAKER